MWGRSKGEKNVYALNAKSKHEARYGVPKKWEKLVRIYEVFCEDISHKNGQWKLLLQLLN